MRPTSKQFALGAAAVVLLMVRGGDARGQPAQEVAIEYFAIPSFFDQLVRSGRSENEIKEQLINRYSQIVTSDFMVQIRGWVGDSSLQSEDFTEALAAVRPINDPWIVETVNAAADRIDVRVRYVAEHDFNESYNFSSVANLIADYRVANVTPEALQRRLSARGRAAEEWLRLTTIYSAWVHLKKVDAGWRISKVVATADTSTADLMDWGQPPRSPR